MILRLLGVLGLVILSGIFSGLTLGMFSLNKTSLERKIKLGDKKAKRVYSVRKNGNLLLCTLLLGNVAVNSAMAVILGEIAYGPIAMLISTGLIVIFGEILPQAVFSRFALKIGAYTTWLIWIFIIILFPITFPLAWLLDKILGKELPTIWPKKEIEEIIKIHEDSPKSEIDEDEEKIMLGALSFSDKTAVSIMTPKTVVYCLESETVIDKKLLMEIKDKAFTRIPVYKEKNDNIVGILMTKELIGIDVNEKKKVLDLCNIENLIFVKETIKLDKLFNQFIETRLHIAFIYDDFGIFKGIVSLEDIIEEILKTEIVDEVDKVENMREFARQLFKKKLIG